MIQLDIEDIFLSAIGGVLGRGVLGLGAVWTGCFVSGVSLEASAFLSHGFIAPDLLVVVLGPMSTNLLFLLLLLLVAAVSAGVFARLSEPGVIAWGGLAAGIALLQVGLALSFDWCHGWLEVALVWFFLLLLLAMLGTALWFLDRWRRQRWARQIEELRAENAARRAEIEARFGTSSFGEEERWD